MEINLSYQAFFRIISILESHHPLNGAGPLQHTSANHIFRSHQLAATYDSPQQQYNASGECSLVKFCFQHCATDKNLELYVYGNSAWLRDRQDRLKH